MPGVEPATHESRRGIIEEPVYEAPWMNVPLESYEGMNQQQYQDAAAPFELHGRSVALDVPRGWRRIESSRPGRHFYVHVASGTISRFPADTFDCKQDCWISRDGDRITDEELALPREQLVLRAVGAEVAASAAPAQLPDDPEPSVASSAKPTAAKAEPGAAATARPPMPVALLFPGQGSQKVGMLSNVQHLPAVKDMLTRAESILGYDVLSLCLNGPEAKLEQTKYCQVAMYVAGLAAVEALRVDRGDAVERCQALAGLSLGEYTALTAAGVFNFEAGLRIVKFRAEIMQEAAEASPQSMASVAGLSKEKLDELCGSCCRGEDFCQIANFLFPNGFACAGSTSAVEHLLELAVRTEGCLQAKLLKTSGAFHTPMMQHAKARLLSALQEMESDMRRPRCDVFMNVSGCKITPETSVSEIIYMLGEQLVNCVLWEPCMKGMIKDGIREFFECGPNKQLKSMLKRIDADAWKGMVNVEV